MQACTNDYKNSMLKPFRNRSHLRINLGVINQEAQTDVKVKDEGNFTYFTNFIKPFSSHEVEIAYAMLEKNYTRVDGSMCFLPKEEDDTAYINQGLVSENKKIRLEFSRPFNIKGLSLDFSEAHPYDFDIITNNSTQNIRGNNEIFFISDEILRDTEFIEIKVIRMINEGQRLRLKRVIFGQGIYFDNKDIITATKKEHISPIMENLQAIDFKAVIDNKKGLYNVENDTSSINFLELGQKLEVLYGYELDDGNVEWIKGSTLKLKNFSCDDKTLTLNAHDVFYDMNKKFDKGTYTGENGRSLYDLASEVLNDAGVDELGYELSNYLKKIKVNNPLPLVSHKEALQLIANAGRCLLYQDRDGKIIIKSNFTPRMGVDYEGASVITTNKDVILNGNTSSYALLSKRHTKVDGSMNFLLPVLAINFDAGYISSEEGEHKVVINLEAEYTFFNMAFNFVGVAPLRMLIKSFNEDGEITDTLDCENVENNFIINYPFKDIVKLEIEFIEIKEGTRVVLNKITLGDKSDYMFEYSKNLKEYPKGRVLEKVGSLNMYRSLFLESGEVKEIVKDVINPLSERVRTYHFNNPVYNLSLSTLDGLETNDVEIIEEGAYMCKVRIEENATGSLIILANEYKIAKPVETIELNKNGNLKKWDNPLISSLEHAKDVANWLIEFIKSDIEYTLADRGEPRIDAGDVTFLERKGQEPVYIKITDYTLNFNGALTGSVKSRKVVSYVD